VGIDVGGFQNESDAQFQNRNSVTASDSVDASFDLAQRDTIVGAASRLWAARGLEQDGGKKISPDQANERFPDMEEPFREPINERVAQFQYDQSRERQRLERKVMMGPSDPYTRSKQFGVGLLAHMMDPVELGASTLTGWGVGAVIGRTAIGAAMAARAATSLAARTALNAGEAVAGNLIENTVNEGVVAAADTAEGHEYDPVQGMKNLAMSTFLGAIPGMALKEVSFHMGHTSNLRVDEAHPEAKIDLTGLPPQEHVEVDTLARTRNGMLLETSPEADLAVVRGVVGNLENDVRPDVTPMFEALARETDVNPADFGHTPYNFDPVTPETIGGRRMFMTSREAVPDLDYRTTVPLGDEFGLGLHTTDNPGVANAAAVRSMADIPGTVHEIEIKGELRPLDLDAPIPDNMMDMARKALDHIGEGPELADHLTTHDLFRILKQAEMEDALPQGFMKSLNQGLQDLGYNALVSKGESRMGVPLDNPHNHVTILDPSMIEKKATFEPDTKMVRPPDEQALADLQDKALGPKKSMLIDEQKYKEAVAQVEKMKSEAKAQTSDLKAEIDEQIADFEDMHKQGLLDEGLQKEFEQVKQFRADLETNAVLDKAAAFCMGA
jgi:hypothetical protein